MARTAALWAAALALVVPLLAASAPASAAPSHERGPAPTAASVRAERGPFAVTSTRLPDAATPGFGAATITYPTTATAGTFGGVAISPGFTASQATVAWLRPRLASHGFVVITFDTMSRFDSPDERGDQLLAALDHLVTSSPVRARVDRRRLAVMGHSMGGGGALEAAKDRPSLQAVVALTPWNTDKTWPEVGTPTLVIGAELDTVAPVVTHSKRFYRALPSAAEKAYLELNAGTHFAPNLPSATIASSSISWLKRFVDGDRRYLPFLCPGPSASWFGPVSVYRSTCAM